MNEGCGWRLRPRQEMHESEALKARFTDGARIVITPSGLSTGQAAAACGWEMTVVIASASLGGKGTREVHAKPIAQAVPQQSPSVHLVNGHARGDTKLPCGSRDLSVAC